MKKMRRNLKKTVAITLATTMATSTVAFGSTGAAYEGTHRGLMEAFLARLVDTTGAGEIPVTIRIPAEATRSGVEINTGFDIISTPDLVWRLIQALILN